MNKICVIGVYFGNLSKYFDLWLKSCELNPTVDFIIFTDQTITDVPFNVKVKNFSLSDMKELARKKLGLNVSLDKPYKCCDFRVAYGIIFKDFICKYDYWGHCDFDLIFGDLQYFFDKYDLYSYDKFLTLGHLALYRNTAEVNSRYMCDGSKYNFKEIFETDENYAFDEIDGIGTIYTKNNFSMFKKLIFIDIASVWKRYRMIEVYRYEKPKNYKYQIFYWQNGKVYRGFYENGSINTEEYCYIHFKKRKNFEIDFDAEKENAFYITYKGFVPKKGEITLKDIKKLNPYRGRIVEFFELVKYMFCKKICQIKTKLKNM